MKTKLYILALLVAVSAAFACSKADIDPATEETPVVVDSGSHIHVPFSAEAGATQTRVEMKDGSTTNIVFSAGDQLMVYCFQTLETSLLTLKSGAGEKTAIFEGDLILASGKTEADLAGKTLHAVLIPEAGAMMGIFTYRAMFGQLTVDYSKGSIDSNLEALVARTILYEGETKYEDRKFTFRMMNSYVKMDVTVPSEESDLARNYTVEVTNDWHICANATCGRVGWSTGTYSSTVSGTFTASSATGGTLYMAVLADNQIRITDDGALYDEVDFNIRMGNVYKEYDLLGGTISKAVIPPGRGITKSVTLKDPDNEDVLLGQPESVRTKIMKMYYGAGGDLNRNERLSKYEAAQMTYFNLVDNRDITDASFFQYFTGMTETYKTCFALCKNLTKVILPKHLSVIGERAFSNSDKLTSIIIPSEVKEIKQLAFIGTGLTTITIPTNVTSIGDSVFMECKNLEDVVFETPSRVETIGDATFRDCTSLSFITIPSSITTISDSLFYNCTSLATVNIPNGVKTIGDKSFYKCTSLRTLTIPASVTRIKNYAFNSCGENLVRINCNPKNPPVLEGVFAFTNDPNVKIYVPALSLQRYKPAENWSNKADIIFAH